MTHCIAASVVPRSASIVGSATLTTDSSTNAMVDPNTAAASTQAWSRLAQAEVPRVDRITSAAQGCAFEEITCCRSIRACPGGGPSYTGRPHRCLETSSRRRYVLRSHRRFALARPDEGATFMMIRGAIAWLSLCACSVTYAQPGAASGEAGHYDVLISGGTVYDGSGGAPFVGDVAIKGDRLAYVGPHAPGLMRTARRWRRASSTCWRIQRSLCWWTAVPSATCVRASRSKCWGRTRWGR